MALKSKQLIGQMKMKLEKTKKQKFLNLKKKRSFLMNLCHIFLEGRNTLVRLVIWTKNIQDKRQDNEQKYNAGKGIVLYVVLLILLVSNE